MYRILWGVIVVACAIYGMVQFQPDRLQTNLFDLLPRQSDERIPTQALGHYSERLSRKVGFLIGAQSHAEAVAMAEQAYTILAATHLFSEIHFKLNRDRLKSVYQTYHAYRFGLLSPTARQAIQSNPQWLPQRLLNALVSPLTGLNSATIQDDPFLLYQDFLASLPRGNPNIMLVDGYTEVKHADRSYILIAAELAGSPFDQGVQERYAQMQSTISSGLLLQSNQTLESFGVIHHALENRRLAQSEITVIGTGSLLGILAIFILVFRRSVRLLLILLPVGIGMLMALSVSMMFFDNIHLISLVFGISLIGVSIDYALHYGCANSNLTAHRDGNEAVRSVRSALTLGLLTTLVGYFTLATTQFPALRQMAVIAIAGLLGAYFTVLLWLPKLLDRPLLVRNKVETVTLQLTERIAGLSKLPLWIVVTILTLLLTLIILSKHSNDDLKMMRASLPQLDQIDEHFKQVLGEYPNSQYILIKAATAPAVLERERRVLQLLRDNHDIHGRVEGLSDWVPSRESQLHDKQLLHNVLIDNAGLKNQLRDMGIPEEIPNQYIQALHTSTSDVFTLDAFLGSPLGQLKSDAWLGEINDQYYTIINLYGIDDLHLLEKLISGVEDSYLIDRVRSVSSLLAYYRVAIEKMFPYVMLAVFLLLFLRYGLDGALRVVAAPVIAALASFLCVQFILGQYNLFTVFGLIVTIAIAIDYAVFIRESTRYQTSTFLAITLAGITTVLAFGLLSLSQTPALRTFGLSLLLGILFSYLITPLIVMPGTRRS